MIPVSIGDVTADEWDDLAHRSPQAWLFHHWQWNAVEAEWTGSELLSFALRHRGRVVAIQPLYRSLIGLGTFEETLIHSGLHRHTGLALDPALSPAEIASARTEAMNQILSVSGRCNADRIYLSCQNLAPDSLSPARCEVPFWVTDYQFELGNSLGPQGLAPGPGLATTIIDQIVDLRMSEEELFNALDESCRRAVRKGLKAGCVARELAVDDHSLTQYLALARESAVRTGETPTAFDIYAKVRAAAAKCGAIRMVEVSRDGRMVAAALVLSQKQGCYFLAGVSDPNHLDARVNDVLHWSAIRFAKLRGEIAYRLGPFFPTVPPGWPIETVSRFKSKFGARATTIVQGSRYLHPQRYREMAQAHIARLCGDLPEGV